MNRKPLVGRSEELGRFESLLDNAIIGNGCTLIVSGDAGIGKTHFVTECRNRAAKGGAHVISAAASPVSLEPFQLFSKLLTGPDNSNFFSQERISFSAIYLVNQAGLLIAKASNEKDGMDADIVAGMMSAIQNFIRQSLDSRNDVKGGLDRLEYGNLKIIIEHGEHFFLTAVLKGSESSEIRAAVKSSFKKIDGGYKDLLTAWKGDMKGVKPVQEIVSALANMSFTVKRELSGAMLETERNRVSDAIFSSLRKTAADSPVLIILEDLHWADDSSLAVLNYLSRNIPRERIMILATMRPNESGLLSVQLEKMRSENIYHELMLGTLTLRDVTSLVAGTYPENDFPEGFIQSLSVNCAGNPFFITELLKQMGNDGQIIQKNGKFIMVSADYAVPNAVGEFVSRKLEKLEPDVMALLEYAACIGVRFDEVILKSYPMLDDVSSAIGRLYGTGIVTQGDGTAEFSHAIFQDAIYKDIGNRWKAAHHRSLGEYYEKEYAERLTEVLYELARHFSKSNEYAKAFDYCIRAGEKAETEFAPVQAIELYRNALTVREKGQMKGDPAVAMALHENVGDLLILVGNYGDALGSYRTAGELTADDQARARILRKSASVHQKKGDYREALNVLSEAKKLAGSGRTAEYGRICMLEGDIITNLGDRTKALELLNEANTVLTESGAGLKDIGSVVRVIGTLHYRNGNLEEARKYQTQSLEISKLAWNEPGLVSSYNNLGNISLSEGDYDRALEFFNESLQICQKIGDISGTTPMLSNIGNTYYRKGDFDLAIEYHKKALDLKERFGQKWGIAASNLAIGVIHFARGELEQAKERYDRSHEIWEKMGDKGGLVPTLNNIGELHLMNGEPQSALIVYGRSLVIAEKSNEKLGSTSTLCGLALTHLKLEDYTAALEHGERALKIAREAKSVSVEGKCRWVLGTIYREMGEHGKSGEMFRQSVTILEECGNKGEEVYARYEYGLLLAAIGRPAEAREHLEKSLSMFRSMGMKLWVRRAEDALRGLSENQ